MLKQSMIRKPRLKYRVQVTVKIKVYCGKAVNDKEPRFNYVKECCSITVKYQETQVFKRSEEATEETSRKSHNFDVKVHSHYAFFLHNLHQVQRMGSIPILYV